ncbi:MAG TPA: disulfide bond formation protein B [Casimicrobiaceae bacterium]|nr:disulfide bond formation protein B [Casimicrobiaceae bacterium]
MTAMRTLLRKLGSPSRVALALGVVCVGLVGASLFVQHVLDVEPCPLCIVQRFTYLALIPVFLGAAVAKPYGKVQRSLLWGATVLTLAGLAVAGYQTDLQLSPPGITASCSAGLGYMLDTMAVSEVLARLLHAGGDCADTSFRILGLTLAQASLIIFTIFAALLAGLLLRSPNRGER